MMSRVGRMAVQLERLGSRQVEGQEVGGDTAMTRSRSRSVMRTQQHRSGADQFIAVCRRSKWFRHV